MISQFFVLSQRGDNIVFRDYRGEVPKGSTEIFFRKVKFWKGDDGEEAPPIFNVDGVNYLHVKVAGLLFVATTRVNVSPALVLELLQRIARVIKDYLGILNEDSLRKNFVLVYELLDEVIDFGYPQTTSTEVLKSFIFNEPIVVDAGRLPSLGPASLFMQGSKRMPGTAVTKSVVANEPGGKKREEVFVDIIEKISVTFSSSGYILTSEIDGTIQMKSYLTGNPEIRLALNEDLSIGRSGPSSYDYSSSAGAGIVVLDDCNFHESVRLDNFDLDRPLTLMARWDDILMLPVQEPPTIVFSSADLIWSKVEGWGQNVDNVARIPFSRVDDFVKGESSSVEYPTKFRVEARRKKTESSSYKPRVDGYLEYILYWCCYGPDDHRKGGTSRPSRKCIKPSKKKSSAGRPHTKRGCMCHFIVKRLYAQPSVALIIYNQRKHVDKSGSPCHGPLDTKAIGTLALYAPYISEELRQQITSMLYAGISVESIIQNHKKIVERQGGPCNRDAFLSRRFVRTVERNIRRSTHELDSDDALSIKLWVGSHQNQVFYYQESSHTDAFILGIQTEWQLQQMLRFGKNSLMAVDSSCGTKKFKYPIYTLLAFDSNQITIPIAWIIAGSLQSHDVYKWMGTLRDRVRAKDSTWRLNGFIIDDASTEISIIRDVFQCTILLCLWRVRHAWHINIIKKCANPEMQREILKRLGHIMYNTWSGSNVINAMEDFIEDFVDHSAFVEYFIARWMQRIEMWVTAMRILPVASQETCAAIEAYHSLLKSRMLISPDVSTYQRADWLVHKLTNEVHAYFWVDQFSVENDICGYIRDENYASTSWRKALLIADSDVIFNEKDHTAKVLSQSDRTRTYIVWNPGSEFSLCECAWSMSGKLCKHVIKTVMLCRDRQMARPSMALQTYHQALLSLLRGPPNGSVVLDNAISLGISMHQDLKRQVEPANHSCINSLLSVVPVKWICKKSRTSRPKATVINGNNNSMSGHRVTTDVEDGAINKTGLDENVMTDAEDGAINKTGLDENVMTDAEDRAINKTGLDENVLTDAEYGAINKTNTGLDENVVTDAEDGVINETGLDDNVMIDAEDGVINETGLDQNVMVDAEDGAINKTGLDDNVMTDAEDGVINKTALDENVSTYVEDGAVNNTAFDENVATDAEDEAVNDTAFNDSAATDAEDGAINNTAFNENAATDSEEGVINKGALNEIITTYAEDKAVNKILLDKSVISESMDAEKRAISKGVLDEIVTTYVEDEAMYKTSLDEIISSYAEDEAINESTIDEIVATYAEDTSISKNALDDIVTTYSEDEAINKTALDEIITTYAEDVAINKSALDEIVATYGEDVATNETSMDENVDNIRKLQLRDL